jgi:pimeloyl-ACP methyl ester carboxylesterase
MTTQIKPFTLEITDDQLRDLRERLRRTRWPEAEPVDDWSQGIPSSYLRELCRYWEADYDQRRVERRLNGVPQFRTEIDGLAIHFLQFRSPEEHALPLLMTHGWPGSVLEFLNVAQALSNPAGNGGDRTDAFHVVCPSLPGYGFSDKPATSGVGLDWIARAWVELMTRLGYDRYGAQGGDWGAHVTTRVARIDPERVVGIHLNLATASPKALIGLGDLTDLEREYLAALDLYRQREAGYATQQSTRPQTLGYGLVDSPAALCAWIVEKFFSWTDCDGHPENAVRRDELLDNVMMYWLPAAGASSARLYWESFADAAADFEPIAVPTGYSVFPREVFRLSRRWAETRFTELRYFNELDRGGHFAALEQPGLFVDEVRRAFRPMR